jgi:signal transduction histidine kinase
MSLHRRLIGWLKALPPHRLDALAGLLVLVETQIEALLVAETAGERVATHLIGLGAALCLALHRRATLPAFLAVNAIFVAGQGAGDVVTDNMVVPLFVVLAVSVSAAAQLTGRRFWLVPLTTATAGIVGLAIDDYPDEIGSYAFTLLFFTGATAAGGRLLHSRLTLQRTLREKAEREGAEEAARAEQAVADERTRIAGELHDIIAHALSGMVVQAAGARRLADRDADRARESFAAIEASGRDALAELRRLLGVLRREDDELALAPSPSLAHVEALARRVSAAGLPVRLTVEGDAVALPAGVDVTAYRVVQEALAAALEATTAGQAAVLVRYRGDDVVLEVRDDGRDTGVPRPLTGMRERVRLFGGELEVGAGREGGHALRARLPTEAAA